MITYLDDIAALQVEQLVGFFVGWPNPPDPATHLRLLHHSSATIIAVDADSRQVVGFVTAISDGVLSAYIPCLEVLPAYQGQGIGKTLMETMLAKLSHLYMVDLLCDPDVQPFYEHVGMQRAAGMLLRHYEHQSGS